MWSVWVRVLVSSVVVLGGLGAAPVGRAAAGGWQGVSMLAAGYGSDTGVGLGADGTAVASWFGSTDRYVAVRTPGSQSFGEPVDLGNAQEGSGAAVATDTKGDSVAAWLEATPVSGQIVFDVQVDYRPAGGQFSESTVATIPDSTYATVTPVVWFLPDGTAVVAWGGRENGHQPVIADSVRPPGVGSGFGAANSYDLPSDAEPGAAYRALQIAPGKGDSATLLWENVATDRLSNDEYVEDDDLMVGRVDAQGGMTAAPVPGASTEEHVSNGPQASYSGTRLATYALAGDAAGDLAVTWGVEAAPESARGAVYGSYASSGQQFQNTPDLIDANVYVGAPIVGSMLASGTATFASEWESTGAQYVERARSAATFPATLTSLPGVSDANDPQLAAGAGQTIVEYTGDGGLALYSAIAPDDEPFGSPTLLADTGEDWVALASDGQGNAVTLFDEHSSSSNEIDLMTDTFAAETVTDGSGPGGASVGTPPSSAPAASDTKAASSTAPSDAPVAANGAANPSKVTNPRRLALHLAAAIAWFAHNLTRTTIPARCATAPAHTCLLTGRLFAARWQPRTREWVKTRIRLGTITGTLHGSRLGQLTVRLAPAGLNALHHSRLVDAWLSGTLRSSRQHTPVAIPIRLELTEHTPHPDAAADAARADAVATFEALGARPWVERGRRGGRSHTAVGGSEL